MSGGTGAVSDCPSRVTAQDSPELDSGTSAAIHDWPFVSLLEFGPLPTAVPCARLHTRHVLREWNIPHLTDDAELLVSEMVTNAVNASCGGQDRTPIALRLLADDRRLVIEVFDRNLDAPAPRPADSEAESGRGIAVIEALSNRWGHRRLSYAMKVVWCELLLRSYL